MKWAWKSIQGLPSKSYVCGKCGTSLSSEKGWVADDSSGRPAAFIYICHDCTYPTFIGPDGEQIPGIPYGDSVPHVSDSHVNELYEEARRSTAANAYTAAVLCCRKLLMHIAVAKGATSGQSFADYVDFLAKKGYVPPDGCEWVDHIRKKGNEANHEIAIMGRSDAEELIGFAEMLLRFIYEFPARVKKSVPDH
jgi:hypothetical protein